MSEDNEDMRIMRIRVGPMDTSGYVEDKDRWRAVWDHARRKLRSFDFKRSLQSDYIVLTNQHNKVAAVVVPTRITKSGDLRPRYILDGETVLHELLGQDDPVPNNSKQSVAYNWG